MVSSLAVRLCFAISPNIVTGTDDPQPGKETAVVHLKVAERKELVRSVITQLRHYFLNIRVRYRCILFLNKVLD
jgi:hypothetical protein